MSNDRRQELYERIRKSSKDEVILEEMKRLGFWPDDQDMPEASEELIKRRGELQREMRELMKKQRMYQNPEEALQLMRKERMEASKLRRIETKQKRLQQRYEKALHWHQRRQQEILHIGDRFSHGLNHSESNNERLQNHQLPLLQSAKDLAEAMGINLSELRFLSFTRDISRINHYQKFVIAKKTGGERQISAPMPRLKRAQYWILNNILEKIPLHDAAHGFRAGKSIVSNAKPHCAAYVVINYDLKDFFPSVSYRRVKGLFRQFGYSEQVATICALLCSEPETQQVELDDDNFHVSLGERVLPQGAPSSPVITNILCRRLDRRLNGAAKSLGFAYTRYADDMSFSADRSHAKNLAKLQWRVKQIVADEGFEIHPDKTRIMRANSQQEVTGIVVNEKPSLDRKTLKRFRALLFQIEKDGCDGKHWGQSQNVLSSIKGFANYVAMVNPDKGKRLLDQVNRILKKEHYRSEHKVPGDMFGARFKHSSASGKAPRQDWWQPLARPEPQPPKPVEKPKPAITETGERRSTREIIDSAVRETRTPARPRRGFWRRLFVEVKDIFWWAVIIFATLQLAKSSITLAVIFFLIAALFRGALRG